jgi:hypothetical protein
MAMVNNLIRRVLYRTWLACVSATWKRVQELLIGTSAVQKYAYIFSFFQLNVHIESPFCFISFLLPLLKCFFSQYCSIDNCPNLNEEFGQCNL